MGTAAEETKIIYHIGDEDTPYLIKLPISADRVTLKDFKDALQKPSFKYFFKSMDDDFGVVKEEIIDDNQRLPCFNGRVVSWLVAADSSDTQSQLGGGGSSTGGGSVGDTRSPELHHAMHPPERTGGIGDSRPPSFHSKSGIPGSPDNLEHEALDTFDENESVVSSRRDHHRLPRDKQLAQRPLPVDKRGIRHNGHSSRHQKHQYSDTASTVTSSDLDTTSFCDSDEDCSSRYSTVTGDTNMSSKYGRHRTRRRRFRPQQMSRTSSFSSITDSTMSLNVITVTLNMDTVSFLGISIVGQSNKGGDGGIYVGSIMKGGAVAQDGRIEPGDMILEVNGISFENMTNDAAVRTLREAVQKPGPITLVVAKCWDPNPKGYFTIPRQEPVRPIDPSAWVAHTTALQHTVAAAAAAAAAAAGPGSGSHGVQRVPLPSLSQLDTMSTNSSINSSTTLHHESSRLDGVQLAVDTADMLTIARAMAHPDSGLEVRDRMWLKITIPNAFIGSDLVDWLFSHVAGFSDRRDARKYACNLLKAGYIRHTVNKLTFSEQCYYVFGDLTQSSLGHDDVADPIVDLAASAAAMKLSDRAAAALLTGCDQVLPPPLPPPSAWNSSYGYAAYMPPLNYVPPPYSYTNDAASYQSLQSMPLLPGGAGPASVLSQQSGSGSSASSGSKMSSGKDKERKSSPFNSGSETESVVSVRRGGGGGGNVSERSYAMSDQSRVLPPPPGDLTSIPPEVSSSRASFHVAMDNPCEYFVDIM